MIDAFDIADALRDRINAGKYALPVNATTAIPRTDRLEDVRDLQVTVLPTGIDSEPLSRSEDESTFQISIGIQKHLETNEDSEVRELHKLTRAIQARVNRFNVTVGNECASWQGGTIAPIWSATNLIQKRIFTSVIDLVYRVAE
jgi:hypothetical protein